MGPARDAARVLGRVKVLFTGMTFGVMWGYPFLTVGQGLSPASLIAIGIVQTLRYRQRTIRALVENDPEAYAALRRGVHLSPPT